MPNDADRLKLSPNIIPDILVIHPFGKTELLRITKEGEVIAPSLEAASEAGRVFIEAMRGHLDVIRNAIQNEAYQAGQRDMQERAAAVCEAEAVSYRNEWNRNLGVEDTMADAADDCGEAIRALPIKETPDA
jgi:hypothetical protein